MTSSTSRSRRRPLHPSSRLRIVVVVAVTWLVMLLILPTVCSAWNGVVLPTRGTRRLMGGGFSSASFFNAYPSSTAAAETGRSSVVASFAIASTGSSRIMNHPSSPATQLHATNFYYEEESLNSLTTGGPAGLVLPVLVVLALVLGVSANGWISQLMNGSSNSSGSGLADFLRDGRGYSNSAFSMDDSERAVSSGDPLPWLKLPKLDYVQVAGQEEELRLDDDAQVIAELERLRQEINQELVKGNLSQAERLRKQLESLLEKSGMEYQSDDKPSLQ